MQKPSGPNSLLNLLKRTREDDFTPPPQKTPASPPNLPPNLNPNTFRCLILQNGDAKAFWSLPNLRFEIDNNKETFFQSPTFSTGNGDKWNILLWPCKTPNTIGVYLQLEVSLDKIKYSKLATVYIEAYITVDNVLKRKAHDNFFGNFSFAYRDWGYEGFIKHEEYLKYLNKPIVIQVTVCPVKPLEESKELTGYNGIINEGTTCYINSLLQSLYFLTCFRKAVYVMPTTLKDQDRLPLALQMIFYHLQFCNTPASTRDLLASFGWSFDQWNVQHDVQEFNCILSDHLENKMKGTPAEGTYSKLFVGKMESFVKCNNVNYASSRIENFNDLQLNVKDCDDVYKSFDKYIEIESLNGDNKYDAEGYGKQDAEKGVVFVDMPPVLQLQLKRFEYDFYLDRMAKLNQKYDFFEEIDLGKYVKTPGNWKYSLFSILVHKGNAVAGHYFSYICPKLDGQWFVFNDDSVDSVDYLQAKKSSLGGDFFDLEVNETGFVKEILTKNETCAYMLVYIKTDLKDVILPNLGKEEIHEHLQEIYEHESKRHDENLKEISKKASLMPIYILNLDTILNWAYPGITCFDNDLYNFSKFFENSEVRAQLEVKKDLKGKDLYEEIRKIVSNPIKLWILTPGFKNWDFKALDLHTLLSNQLNGKAIFLECEKNVLEIQNKEWKFIESCPESPMSQATEILDEDWENLEKVFFVFKWYEYSDKPNIRVIWAGSIQKCKDVDGLRKEAYKAMTNSQVEYNGKMRVYIEKSKNNPQNPHDLNIIIIESYENFQISYDDNIAIPNKISLSNGDSIICEEVHTIIHHGYVTAKEHLNSLYKNISIYINYYNKNHRFGYESYSSELLKEIPDMNLIKLNLSLDDTLFVIKQQIANMFANIQKVNFDQVALFLTDPKKNNANPCSLDGISDDKKTYKTVSDMLSTGGKFFFDVLPYPMGMVESKMLVYVAHVNEKFVKIKQYYKLLNKEANVSDLDNSLQMEIMSIFNDCPFESAAFYLVSYPQNAIIKELSLCEPLQNYIDKANYILCFRTLSNTEKALSEDRSKLYIFTYTKGSEKGTPEVMYFDNDITCKSLLAILSQSYEEKIRIWLFMQYTYADRIEIRASRPLEESDAKFFDKHPEKTIGVELPSAYFNRRELKIQ